MSISIKERGEIFKAINAVSKKVNGVEKKLDEVIHLLNADCNNKISVNSSGVEDLGNVISAHNDAIDELATIISGLEECNR